MWILHQQWRRHHDGQPEAWPPASPARDIGGGDLRHPDRYEAPRMHVHALAWIIRSHHSAKIVVIVNTSASPRTHAC